MTIATLAAALAVTVPAAPLQPTGKWVVEYADNMCVLSHDYGEGDSRVTIGFRPWPMGDETEIVILNQGPRIAGLISGRAQVTLSPGGTPIDGTYNAFYAVKTKLRVTTINIDRTKLATLGDATSISIALGGKAPLTVAPPTMSRALTALAACDKDLLRSWHVDPNEEDAIAIPAKPSTDHADWITAGDYPGEALQRGAQGTETILWTVGTDGRVSNCSVVASSGDPELDRAGCAAISRSGRYKPALDKHGQPIASHNSRRIVWRLNY